MLDTNSSFEQLTEYLDSCWPDLGQECPLFPVAAVVLAAAIKQTTSVEELCAFTGYDNAEFISAIEYNMKNSRLWVEKVYHCSGWLYKGIIVDLDELCDHVQVAEGTMRLKAARSDNTMYPCDFGPSKPRRMT